jgi:hypothetical protein
MSNLINRSNVKKVALAESAASRNGKFHRVSGSFFTTMEGLLKEIARVEALAMEDIPKVCSRKLLKTYIADVRAKANLSEVKVKVSDLERIESKLVEVVRGQVRAHPSVGVTLQGA